MVVKSASKEVRRRFDGVMVVTAKSDKEHQSAGAAETSKLETAMNGARLAVAARLRAINTANINGAKSLFRKTHSTQSTSQFIDSFSVPSFCELRAFRSDAMTVTMR